MKYRVSQNVYNMVFFANISEQTNNKILIFFSKDAPPKALYEQIPIGKQKSLPNIFIIILNR